LEFLNSEPYYASKKIVNQSSDFPVRRTGSYRHKKALTAGDTTGDHKRPQESQIFSILDTVLAKSAAVKKQT